MRLLFMIIISLWLSSFLDFPERRRSVNHYWTEQQWKHFQLAALESVLFFI